MARRLPPFTAIRAFEATARHLSMTEAADELCVTPSAISHQIKALEAFLDTALLNRDGNRISLTLTGLSYRLHLSSLLDMLDDATRDIAERKDLRVLATPGFAARFLVPRLSRFKHAQMVRLKVSEGAPDTDFSRNGSDVVIQWGEGPVPDVAVEPLMESGRYPVIAPSLKLAEDISAPQDLLRVTLFHDEVMDAWPQWFECAGLSVPSMPRGPEFAHCELSSTAAERGQGVALAYDAVLRDTLRSGSLVRLFEAVTLPVTIYSIAVPETRRRDPIIRAFRDWLFEEVESERVLARSGLGFVA